MVRKNMVASHYYLLQGLVWWLWAFSSRVFCDDAHAGCIPIEQEVLLQFKLGLDDLQGNLDTWTSNNDKVEDCCSGWSGVGCDHRTGHVVELNLRGMKLGARVSKNLDQPTLCRLKHLRHLDFSSNNFSNCNIPSFFGCFRKLRYLNLSTSYFHGIVPSSLGNLSNLVQLDLSKYKSYEFLDDASSPYLKIDDASWLQQLLSLEYIDMSYFQLKTPTSHWIQSLNELPSLSTLICSSCQMEISPKSLKLQFSSLQTLDLSHCGLNGDVVATFITGSMPSLQELDLSWNNFDGFVPPFVGNLSSLQSLGLSGNNFNASIPTFLRNLSSLQNLDLSWNNFYGSIPTFLGNLASLQSLDLSRNRFYGSIPTFLGNLASLQSLDLFGNNFNASIPTFLGNLSSLQYLGLSYNNFSGFIPKSLCNLSFLENLYLAGNDINGANFSKCFGGFSKLQKLSLSGYGFVLSTNHFKNMSQLTSLQLKSNSSSTFHISSSSWIPPFSLGVLSIESWIVKPNEFPTWIRTQDKLSSLILSNVAISGSLPTWIWNFSSSLGALDVNSNDMYGEIPDATNSNNSLTTIDLSSNKFEGSKWLSTISKMMPTLSYLILSNNMNLFGGILLLLCQAQSLQVLDLFKNNFSGEIPDCLMKVQSILRLGRNKFNGTFPKIHEHQCTLESLHLENNELYGSLPSSLSKCSSLAILDLSENKFDGSMPSWTVESMQYLKILSFRTNRLFGNIPHSISRFESLQILDLGNNNLSGPIPMVAGGFKAMKVYKQKSSIFPEINETIYGSKAESTTLNMNGGARPYHDEMLSQVISIDLSNNNFSEGIPHDFGDLHGLVNLNLSGNQLTGRIPRTVSGLHNLETLDLSRNNFSGQIPQEMVKMTFLEVLNLSFNNFSGSVPRGKQFLTFNNRSYIGNFYLCGPPLSKNCKQEDQNSKSKSKNKDDDEKEKLWLYVTAILGFIVGFWTFFGILFFKKTWRYSYLQFLNKTSEVLYMRIIKPIKQIVK